MPSNSYRTFNYNFDDVHRLNQAYDELKPTGNGRRGLGHLTRSAIVTLCACWEQYIEDVIIEGAELLADQARSPDDLPMAVRRVISDKVRAAKHELKPLELAGRGWKTTYLAFAKDDVSDLHSPKTANIQKLIKSYLGFEGELCENWDCDADDLDNFIMQRNMIAHTGRAAGKYIKHHEVSGAIELVKQTVISTDNALSDHLADILRDGRPWNRKNH